MEESTNLRPKCGFCGSEVKSLPHITSAGINLYYCRTCGSILGVTRVKEQDYGGFTDAEKEWKKIIDEEKNRLSDF